MQQKGSIHQCTKGKRLTSIKYERENKLSLFEDETLYD